MLETIHYLKEQAKVNKLKEEAKTIDPYTGTSGFYASLTLSQQSQVMLKELCSILGLPYTEEDELHVTLMYSPDNVPSIINMPKLPCTGLTAALDIFGADSDALVLKLNAPYLEQIHEDLLKAGCQHTWPEYQPHVTLANKVPIDKGTFKYANLMLRRNGPFQIQFVALTIEDIRKKYYG
jgi:hypothetical protein